MNLETSESDMLKIDRTQKSFSILDAPSLADVSITERYDLQEFISSLCYS